MQAKTVLDVRKKLAREFFPSARRIDADGSKPLVQLIMTADPLPDYVQLMDSNSQYLVYLVTLPASNYTLILVDYHDPIGCHYQGFYDTIQSAMADCEGLL